jgi:hypothetical protein
VEATAAAAGGVNAPRAGPNLARTGAAQLNSRSTPAKAAGRTGHAHWRGSVAYCTGTFRPARVAYGLSVISEYSRGRFRAGRPSVRRERIVPKVNIDPGSSTGDPECGRSFFPLSSSWPPHRPSRVAELSRQGLQTTSTTTASGTASTATGLGFKAVGCPRATGGARRLSMTTTRAIAESISARAGAGPVAAPMLRTASFVRGYSDARDGQADEQTAQPLLGDLSSHSRNTVSISRHRLVRRRRRARQ